MESFSDIRSNLTKIKVILIKFIKKNEGFNVILITNHLKLDKD